MATHLPRPQASQQPFHLSPNSPPKHFLPIDTQHRRGRDPVNSTPQQPVTDSRLNGTPAYGNTSLLVPKGPHALTANGEAPPRATMPMNGMPFNTARSPPNAKSTVLFLTCSRRILTRLQILRTFPANSSASVNVRPAKPALSHTPLTSHPSTLRVNISPRATASSAPNALWRTSFPMDDA